MSAQSSEQTIIERRRRAAVIVGIALATGQGALVALVLSGRLAPTATVADAPWYALWFAYTLAGVVVLERVPDSAVGWLLCVVGSVPGCSLLIGLAGAEEVSSALYLVIPPLLLVGLPAAFPDGLGRSRKRRVVFALALGLAGLGLGTVWLPADARGTVSAGVLVLSVVSGLILLVGHLRAVRLTTQPRRAQHAVFLGGFAGAVLVMLLGVLVESLPGAGPSGAWVQLVGLVCLPLGVTIAMVGTGLWGTDLARGRRLLHLGGVALVVLLLGTAVLVAVTGLARFPGLAVGVALGGAALIVAGAWWLWRLLDLRLYGPGPNGSVASSDADAAARLVAAALRSPQAAVTTEQEETPAGALVLDLGQDRRLVVHPRRPGESFTRRDRRGAERMAAELAAQLDRADLRRNLEAAQTALIAQRGREQQRLRAALHDTVGPLLVGAEMQARALRDLSPSPAADGLHDALRQAREAMRDVLDQGSPRALAAGLVPALAEFCRGWAKPPVTFHADVDPDVTERVAAPTANAAYLIIGEALANVSQHARATRCAVRLRAAAGCLVIEVSDDGVGVGPSEPLGIGLASMRGRALELGGDVTITPGSPGTVVTAALPLGGASASVGAEA